MIRGLILILGLSLGMGAVLAVEGRMLHLRRFAAFAVPEWADDLSDATGLLEVFCGLAAPGVPENPPGILSVAGVLEHFQSNRIHPAPRTRCGKQTLPRGAG